jgi:hypothetical protein
LEEELEPGDGLLEDEGDAEVDQVPVEGEEEQEDVGGQDPPEDGHEQTAVPPLLVELLEALVVGVVLQEIVDFAEVFFLEGPLTGDAKHFEHEAVEHSVQQVSSF